jgi:hypothetical protein
MFQLHAAKPNEADADDVAKYLLTAIHRNDKVVKLEIFKVSIDTISPARSSIELLHSLAAHELGVVYLHEFHIVASPTYLFFWKVKKELKPPKIDPNLPSFMQPFMPEVEAKVEMWSLHKKTYELHLVPDQTFNVPMRLSGNLSVKYVMDAK